MRHQTARRAATGILLLAAAALAAPAAETSFQQARPVWLAGHAEEMNLLAAFRAHFTKPAAGSVVLRLTASNLYRASVNGQFVGHGPARAAHGFFRVDEWDITRHLRTGRNTVTVEVASYNVPNYYLPNQPPFLQAEILCSGKVLAATAAPSGGFQGRVLPERVRKTERYSFQRTFSEAYRLSPPTRFVAAPLADAPPVTLLPRRVPYPAFALRRPTRVVAEGATQPAAPTRKLWRGRSRTSVGYPEAEFEVDNSTLAQSVDYTPTANSARALNGPLYAELQPARYTLVDFGVNLTGFIGLQLSAKAPARLLVTFDEVLTKSDVDFRRLNALNAVVLDLAPGTYRFETLEPYTLRYLKLTTLTGSVSVADLHLREYANPNVTRATFRAADPRLNRLFAAGRETFRQNAVDIFMDCPHRERAGWLCDSFFTARVAPDLGGDTTVEHNFLENYLLPKRYPVLPDGVLPMCYPADHVNHTFIPNWTLWLVLELEEYVARSGDRETARAFEPKVLALFDYFRQFRNSDGLLEKLPSWVFVEWSRANDFVQDVNYPSNMLYAATLASAARLYSRPELAAEAARIQDTIRRQSFDGDFFVDNALRRNGRLQITRNRSEVCQYFAFYFGTATPESHPALWHRLRDEFGPDRARHGRYPEIHKANSFVGNMLRAELLTREGRSTQLLDESVAYLMYMAERTGTLWENVDAGASCNHGFASHIVHTLYRDILGIRAIDHDTKTVRLRFTSLKLDACTGSLPIGDRSVALSWKRTAAGIEYRAAVPAGYHIEVENPEGLRLINLAPRN
jgi:alpha-L-rhamnosidase